MPRIVALEIDQAPPASQPLLQRVLQQHGRLPNMLATLAHSPVALAGYLQLGECLAGGVLSGAERERVALAVSQANGCDYCLRAHAWLGRRQGLNAVQQEQARTGHEDALARFAIQLVRQRGQLDSAQFAAARAAGLDEARMLEVVANLAWMTLSNCLNGLAETRIDFPA